MRNFLLVHDRAVKLIRQITTTPPKNGIPIFGYQHWSVMDNFDWTEGYAPHIGFIHVDHTTQKRTIKDSEYHYAKIIRTNGEGSL